MHADGVNGDKNGKLIPGIVTEWEIATDGFSWDFKVRDGVKFHDGSDLTVDDVVWTYEHGFGKGCLEACTNIGNPNAHILFHLFYQIWNR